MELLASLLQPLKASLFWRIIHPMSLKIEEVEHIAKLARLALSDEEKRRYREQLSAILDHMAKLGELDTTGISPMANVVEGASPLRADETRPSLRRDALLKNAADSEGKEFKIPPVFSKREQDGE